MPLLVSFDQIKMLFQMYDFDVESVANQASKSTICTGSGLYNSVRTTCFARFGRSLELVLSCKDPAEILRDMKPVSDTAGKERSLTALQGDLSKKDMSIFIGNKESDSYYAISKRTLSS